MMALEYLVVFLVGLLIGLAYLFLEKGRAGKSRSQAQKEVEVVLRKAQEEAQQKADEILRSAREQVSRQRSEWSREERKLKHSLKNQERRLFQKEESLAQKQKQIDAQLRVVAEREQSCAQREKDLVEKAEEAKGKLEKVAQLTREEARRLLLDEVDKELILERARRVKQMEEEIRREAEVKAKEIVTLAVQKCAVETATEASVSVVGLPSDDMKGRLIGKEGRNIRAFEQLTGVDLIVDDTPEAVVLSCFDPVRREVARLALEKLIADGRIHPARIEEMVGKSRLEVERRMLEEGESAALELGITDMHPEILKLLGRLHFRTSYGQNVLRSCVEAAQLSANLAAELGLDVELAKRAAFLHDLGKSLSHEVQGPHALIGAEIAAKYGEPKGIVHAVAAHHGDVEPQTAEAVVVQVADAISAARPGARKDTVENYVQRMRQLEGIAESFEGVEKCFAIQAGRELRILINPDSLDDAEATLLCRQIAKKVEQEHQYPGQIKVMVIRETRAIEYAR